MKGKKLLIIVLTALVFISAGILGFSTVYRIDEVTVSANLISESEISQRETQDLRNQLLEVYQGKNYFSVDKRQAEEIMKEFPYFRITDFEKSHPNRIIVHVEEEAEYYAVAKNETEYYILGANGNVLDVRDNFVNRLDGKDNILIKGLQANENVEQIFQEEEFISIMFSFCQELSAQLQGLRRNITAIEVLHRTSASTDSILKLTTCEGVKIYVGKLPQYSLEKAKAVVKAYFNLSDTERMTGRIAVTDNGSGLVVGYSKNDEFDI